jgi:hypothetical protein
MFAAILSVLMQVATPSPSAAPERFSILVDPCAATSKDGNEIVVCGGPEANSPRLPLPDERGPPDTPCAARQGGCQVGFGPPIAPIAKAAVGLIKSALAKKPDKRGRVPIDLDGPVGTVN